MTAEGDDKTPGHSGRTVFGVMAVFLAVGAGLVFFFARLNGVPAGVVFHLLTRALYDPDWNSNWTVRIFGISPYVLFYAAWAGTLILAFLGRAVLRRSLARVAARDILLGASAALLMAAGLCQTVNQARVQLAETRDLLPLSQAGRITRNYQVSFPFAQYCRTRAPGRHVARLITDLDPAGDGLMTVTALRYYLYPIDIAMNPDRPADCLVIVSKREPLEAVEPGFVPLNPFDATSLIAVRQP